MKRNTLKMMEQLAREMIDKNIVIESQLRGCSEDEIKNLESRYNIQLPHSYKEFLRKMGKNHGGLVNRNEYAIEYDSVLDMTGEYRQNIINSKLDLELELKTVSEANRLILEQEEILELPPNILLILCRLPSYEFYGIDANGGNDSQVFYIGDDGRILKEHDSFWDTLRMFINGLKIT
jgi:hypothetical protein